MHWTSLARCDKLAGQSRGQCDKLSTAGGDGDRHVGITPVRTTDVLVDYKLSFCEHVERLLRICKQRLYLLSQMRKQGLSDKCIGVVYDAIVMNKTLYALCGWGGYVSQALKDRIDASFRKYRWKLTDKQYNSDDLLSEVESKLFGCSRLRLNVTACIACYLHVVHVLRWNCAIESILLTFLEWCMN